MPMHLWVRAEARTTERRAPVTPPDVARLVEAGVRVTVEESAQRVFDLEEYAAAGAEVAPTGSWTEAPDDAVVLGIKELPDEPAELRHHHVYFAHAFKGQDDAAFTLGRFEAGGGRLSDIEYLTGEDGRRVVAFGYWAGYVGAALAVLHLAGDLRAPLTPMRREDLDEAVRAAGRHCGRGVHALVTGHRGRSGTGAGDALRLGGLQPTGWDRRETGRLDRQDLLDHDLLVNCVLTTVPTAPFFAASDLERARRLRLVSDVTCDVTSETNLLPVNTAITTWDAPVRHFEPVRRDVYPLDVIAIDNLPSLLPREASEGFSADLTPHLLGLADPAGPSYPWRAAREAFAAARRSGS